MSGNSATVHAVNAVAAAVNNVHAVATAVRALALHV